MLSIVLPVYNEAGAVRRTIGEIREALSRAGVNHEIIAVDDGSTDSTREILRGDSDIRLFRHAMNQGYGAALKTGIQAARGECVGIIDADGSYPAGEFPRLVAALTEGVDMVVAARRGSRGAFPPLRRPGKAIIGVLAAFLVGRRIPDLNSGMRVIRRRLLDDLAHLFPDGFSFTTTLTLAALTNRRVVKWVPITYAPRVGSSVLTFRRGLFREFPNFLALVVRIVTYFRPLRFFGTLGILFLALGVANLVRTLVLDRNISDASILLLVAGLQVGLMGLLADLVVRSRA